ncbi:MAG: undecaprenyl-diphosphate phosphatase [Ekhidna sp.]|nr:undecaprenyl-diphosphate phosphatase [Ekhidna sp.]
MTWIESLILGLIQGLTEFLPVSSSGHLEIGAILLDVEANENLLFAVVVHLATALSTIVVFREDISIILRDALKFQWNESTKFIILILISMVPIFIIGVLFEERIESFFSGNLLLVGSMLLITSLFLFFAHNKKNGINAVNLVSALGIGVAQAFAVMPGISRSGATISMALIMGVERSKAARFSFLMVLLPIIGASILQLKDYAENPSIHRIEFLPLLVGFIASFISGFVACRWMIRIVRKGKLTYFAVYCLTVGLIAIISTL